MRDSIAAGKNPVMVLNELGAKLKINADFETVRTTGQPPNQTFEVSCVFHHPGVPPALGLPGSNSKAARNNAALRCMEVLGILPDSQWLAPMCYITGEVNQLVRATEVTDQTPLIPVTPSHSDPANKSFPWARYANEVTLR